MEIRIEFVFSGSSFHRGIKASSTWSQVKYLSSCPSSLNKSLNVSSLRYNVCDSDPVGSICLMATLHVLILLCSSDGQIKTRKRDL